MQLTCKGELILAYACYTSMTGAEEEEKNHKFETNLSQNKTKHTSKNLDNAGRW